MFAINTAGKRRTAWKVGLVALVIAAPVAFVPPAASASPTVAPHSFTCASGLNTGITGWATCWGGPVTFRPLMDCYFAPEAVGAWQESPAGGSATGYVSCPSWSHITGHHYQTEG